jgi:PhzF family phenazine biosynthesis protein
MQVQVFIVNAFTDNDEGGNPAGVVLNADQLSAQQKLAIAQQVGLSETAFVSASTVADYKLEFFTPVRQIPHCGHATIATFSFLNQQGYLGEGWFAKETIDGIRRIRLADGRAFMEQTAPRYTTLGENKFAVLASLGLEEGDLLAEPYLVNTANSFLVLGLKDFNKLSKLAIDLAAINQLSEHLDLIGYYVFSTSNTLVRDASTRMFAPRYGINEESATGTAAGPLACYLYDKLAIKQEKFAIEQGHFMPTPSPSLIEAELELFNVSIQSLLVGGRAKLRSELKLEI